MKAEIIICDGYKRVDKVEFDHPKGNGEALIEAMNKAQTLWSPNLELGIGVFDTHGVVKQVLTNRLQLATGGKTVTFYGAHPDVGQTVIA